MEKQTEYTLERLENRFRLIGPEITHHFKHEQEVVDHINRNDIVNFVHGLAQLPDFFLNQFKS